MRSSDQNHQIGRFLISCPDQPGIVAAVSQFLSSYGANILHSDQHSTGERFFMRIQFEMADLFARTDEMKVAFLTIAESFVMKWKLTLASEKRRLAIFVTKEEHCLQELLYRWHTKEMDAEISLVVSNHPDLKRVVEPYHIPYHHIPVARENREEVATLHLQLLNEAKVDTVILARYMQIIPKKMINQYKHDIINIHHSFLPAFIGANPYDRAYERGVKIIGATAHYVNEELDQGPIIEQDVERVSHRHTVEDLKRIGRDVERMVLARAVDRHLNDQVLVYGNKTVVFPG